MAFKVLWCDRNYDYVDSFIAATKNIIPQIEFVIKDDPVEAIKEILANKGDYKLIISGQVFKNMNGTELFEIIFNNKIKIPFLLLTAQIDYAQFGQYDLWYSFSYIDKLKFDFYEIAEKIKELTNRDITATFQLHEKLKSLRLAAKLTQKEMASIVGVSESEVLISESNYDKVMSSYVTLITHKFNISMSVLSQSSLDYFIESVIPKSLETQAQKKYGV